jgi:pimeloyl-ACP methyl ester carboxylesterase
MRSVVLLVCAALTFVACDGGSDGDGSSSAESQVTDLSVPSSGPSASSDPSVTSEPATPPRPRGIEWTPCEDLLDLECGSLEVPLDHAEPTGPSILIAVARRPVDDPAERIGSLVLNPGGPGGSGLEFLELAAPVFPTEVRDVFDLVSFDPRGVGSSSAVDCDLTLDDGVELVPDDDRGAWDELLSRTDAELDTCEAEVDGLQTLVGTNNAARDLDLLRDALGDEQLTYVGFSYGTRLGATYAELFPDRVRALVLDGAVEPTTDFVELGRAQAAGFDQALERFASACDADPDCIVGELGAALDVIAEVRREIDDVGSFDAGDGRELTPGELDLGMLAALYSKDAWPFLAQALYLAETEASGELFQVLADSLLGRRPDGSYSNQNEAQAFISCADDPARLDADDVWAAADDVADGSEHFGELLRASTGCIGLPDPVDPLVFGPADGAAPILVIGTTGDPATPYQWAVELAGLLASGVLYTVEGEGHTAYTSIDCVEPVVNAYLVDLELPADESCADGAGADFFVPAGESEADRLIAFFDCVRDEGVDVGEITVGDLLADPMGDELLSRFDLDDPDVIAAFQACQSLLSS